MESLSQSQLQIQIPRKPKAATPSHSSGNKLSLHDYLDFLMAKSHEHLTVKFLNQVVSMHGFAKVFSGGKKVLIDAVEALDVIDPSRSTLQSGISSSACMTLEDIIADLNNLNWQECCVTSIKILNSPKEISSSLQVSESSTPNLKPKRKRKAIGKLMADTEDLNQDTASMKPLKSAKESSSSLQGGGSQLTAPGLKLKPEMKKRGGGASVGSDNNSTTSLAVVPYGSDGSS